jgi:hypothetical protein
MLGRDRRKNKDPNWKRKIGQSLRGKAKKVRKAGSKAVVKASEGVGYGLSKIPEDKLAKLAKKSKDAADSTKKLSDKNRNKLSSLKRGAQTAVNKTLDQAEPGTRAKATGSLLKGYTKGKLENAKQKKKGKNS